MKLTKVNLLPIPHKVIIYVILPYLRYNIYTKKCKSNIKALFGYFKMDNTRKIWLIWRNTYYKGFGDRLKKLTQCRFLNSLTLKFCYISDLKGYPLLTSLTLNECNNISELGDYPFLTSLTLKFCKKISELKEYPLLTYLFLNNCDKIIKLKEYPLITSLILYNCKISELQEYPCLTYLNSYNCIISEFKEYPLLNSLILDKCDIGNLKEYPLLNSLKVTTYLIPFTIESFTHDRRPREYEVICDNKICIDTSNKQEIQLSIKMMNLFLEIDKV